MGESDEWTRIVVGCISEGSVSRPLLSDADIRTTDSNRKQHSVSFCASVGPPSKYALGAVSSVKSLYSKLRVRAAEAQRWLPKRPFANA